MDYDPFDKNLPAVSTESEQVSNVAASRQNSAGMDKKVFKILMLFSFIVVVVASVAIGAVVLTSNQPAQPGNQTPNPSLSPAPTPAPTPSPQPSPSPTPAPAPTPSPTGTAALLAKGWIKYRNLVQGYDFYLPPAKDSYVVKQDGQTLSWKFAQIPLTAGASFPGFGEYTGLSVIEFSPSLRQNCDPSCGDYTVAVFTGDFDEQRVDLLNQFIDTSGLGTSELDAVPAQTGVAIKDVNDTSKWGQQVYEIIFEGELATPNSQAFMFVKNGKKYFVVSAAEQTDTTMAQDLISVLDNLGF